VSLFEQSGYRQFLPKWLPPPVCTLLTPNLKRQTLMATNHGLSVLLIDSNDTDCNYYADRLKQNSSEYVVHLAATGQDGLETYQARPIDCVVLELDLADMSGFEVLVRFVPVARNLKVAVIILTRLANFYLKDLVMKNGAVACSRTARLLAQERHHWRHIESDHPESHLGCHKG
jgi:DNA-binding response OmpR family regulator